MSSDTPPINSSVKMKEKNSPFLNPTADSSNEMLGKLLNELRMMRTEIKAIKEDVSMMKMKHEGQRELFSEMKKSLKEMEENQMKLETNVTRNEHNQQNILHELKENVRKIEKELEFNRKKDLGRQIYGKWKDVKRKDVYIFVKLENDSFMIKYCSDNCYSRHKLGVKQHNGFMVTVENNKVVQRGVTNQGKEEWRFEYYIENGKLINAAYNFGSEEMKEIYERVGDPDSD